MSADGEVILNRKDVAEIADSPVSRMAVSEWTDSWLNLAVELSTTLGAMRIASVFTFVPHRIGIEQSSYILLVIGASRLAEKTVTRR